MSQNIDPNSTAMTGGARCLFSATACLNGIGAIGICSVFLVDISTE